MAAKFEEVILDSDGADPQQLFPYRHKLLLQRVGGSHELPIRFDQRTIRDRQCCFIHFSVLRQRERLQRHAECRQHVFRQALFQKCLDRFTGGSCPSLADNICNNPLVSLHILSWHHGRL